MDRRELNSGYFLMVMDTKGMTGNIGMVGVALGSGLSIMLWLVAVKLARVSLCKGRGKKINYFRKIFHEGGQGGCPHQ